MTSYIGKIDIVVIFLYFVVLIGIGAYYSRRVKDAKDFSTGGQNMSLPVMIGSTVATCMGSSIVFGNLALVHENGLSGLTAGFWWYVGWIALCFLARPLRASGAVSIPGYLKLRFNKRTKSISAFSSLIMATSSTAAQFLACGVMMEALGVCDSKTGTIIGAVIIVLFTVFSGLTGVAVTDTIQSVLLVIGVGIVIPIVAFAKAGGVVEVFQQTDPIRLDPFAGIAPVVMFGWFLSKMLSCGAHPAYAQRIFAAKNIKTAVTGTIISDIICTIVFIVAALPAFVIPILFPDMTSGDMLVPTLIAIYFPPVLKGIMISALLGLLLTSGDTWLLVISSTLTDDIIPSIRPDIDSKRMLKYSRLIIIVSAALVIFLAWYWKSVYQLLKIGGSAYGAGVFFPLVLGCFWKKAKAKAINVAMFTGTTVSILWDYILKKPTNIDGVIPGAILCLAICVAGSLFLNEEINKTKEVGDAA